MFKARHRGLDLDLISLDPALSPDELAAWARQGHLFCPGCSAEVGYRRPGQRRAHFFHRTRQECEYGHDDPEVLAARALLYVFLLEKVREKGGTVDIEHRIDGAPENALVDVWLELPGAKPVAYRIFTKGPRTGRFEEIDYLTKLKGAVPRYLLCISRRTWDAPSAAEPRLSIPAYDRNLFFRRDWDKYHLKQAELKPGPYHCLLYIDPEREELVQYRRVRQDGDCNPNVHRFDQEQTAPIRAVRIRRDGEFVFPDELDQRSKWEAWKQAEEDRKWAERELAERKLQEWREAQEAVSTVHWPPDPAIGEGSSRPAPGAFDKAITCSRCGQVTSDYWLRNGDGTGECRACLYRKQGLEPKLCVVCGAAYHPGTRMVDGRCLSCRAPM